MKKIFTAFMISASFVVIITSCKKDGTTADPEAAPSAEITIASPTGNQIYQLGDTMHIIATIEGNVKMHGYAVAVINTTSGDTVFQADNHGHETELHVEEQWCCNLSSATDLRLYISSALNHDGLEAVKTVDFKAAQ